MPDLPSALAGVLVGALATFFLSILRFRVEKRWEQRLHAYRQVIEALHHKRNYPAYLIDVEVEGRIQDEAEIKKLADNKRVANRQIELAISQGFLVLEDDVQDRLKQYQNDVGRYPAALREDWFGQIDHDWGLADACLKDIIGFAQRDLNKATWWWGALWKIARKAKAAL